MVVGYRTAEAEIVEAFVRRIHLALTGTGFSTYCSNYRGWTPATSSTPHFFGMLWFTCLVAYGYPDTLGGFHDRMERILGRSQKGAMRALPSLWTDLSTWSRFNREAGVRPLELPEPCPIRTNIGYSWFLAYPHRDDRRRLREALEQADLIGEEPPIKPVLDALARVSSALTSHFREDLAHFRQAFLESGEDVRKSPFWRAIRQVCLEHGEVEEELARPVLLALHYDRLLPYAACFEDTPVPDGFVVEELLQPVEGYSHYVVARGQASPLERMVQAARALLEGRIATTSPISRQAQRGVIVFRETDVRDEFAPATGSEADGMERALVRDDLVAPFKEAFGGFERACLPGWQEVIGCRVKVREEPPPGLPGLRHLQHTQVLPGLRLVDGIPCDDGYLLLHDFLPRARCDEATQITVLNDSGTSIGQCRRGAEFEDWILPKELEDEAPGSFQLRATYGFRNVRKTSVRQLRIIDEHIGHHYREIPSGRFELEVCVSPGFIEVTAGDPLPLESVPTVDRPVFSMQVRSHGTIDRRARRVREAIAAIASRRKDFRVRELIDLFEPLFPGAQGASKTHLRVLLNAYVASGALDLVRRQGWRSTIVVARRPRFVYCSEVSGPRARLVGLVPYRLEEEALAISARLGAEACLLSPGGSKVPGLVEIVARDLEHLAAISSKLCIEPPVPAAGFPAPIRLEDCVRTSPIPDQYQLTKNYDFGTGHFVPIGTESTAEEVRVVRREHPQHHPAFVVMVGDEPLGWSRERNQALLAAFELRTGTVPFDVDQRGSVIPLVDDVFLPLGLSRASAIYGEAPPGMRSVQDEHGYHPRIVYFFGDDQVQLLRRSLPFPDAKVPVT